MLVPVPVLVVVLVVLVLVPVLRRMGWVARRARWQEEAAAATAHGSSPSARRWANPNPNRH